jgi:cob(I)alamin adenosyltransferase
VHIYTGDGKGKTTASVGLAVRAAGAGFRVAFVQFVKGGPESSELESLRRLGVVVTRPATASSGLMRGAVTEDDLTAAAAAIQSTEEALAGDFDVVVLDEACVAASRGLVDPQILAAVIGARAPHVEVVMTGRGAPDVLVDLADYVTEMKLRKHPFQRGVPARRGVEF